MTVILGGAGALGVYFSVIAGLDPVSFPGRGAVCSTAPLIRDLYFRVWVPVLQRIANALRRARDTIRQIWLSRLYTGP